MKTAIAIAALAAGVCFGQSSAPAMAGSTAGLGTSAPGIAASNTAQAPPKDEMSNEQAGVDIDRFIGGPVDKPVPLSHGTLLTHTILRSGNPYEPGPRGAVLEYRKELATATLPGMTRTPLSTLPDEYFFYVQSGEGRLDDGKLSWWPLRPGIAILAAPGMPHRFIN
jgi:hypothetical protein